MIVLGLYGACGWHPSATHKWVHSSGAALIEDGVLMGAISEERLSRIKHTGVFPAKSIDRLLDSHGLSRSDVDYVGASTCIHSGSEKVTDLDFLKSLRREFSCVVFPVDHHKSHSLLAYLSSPFDEASVFTFDGAGSSYPDGSAENALFSLGKGEHLYPLIHSTEGKFGLGEAYNFACRESYIRKMERNITPIDNPFLLMETAPGKIMGLAGYGDATKVDPLDIFSVGREEDYGFPYIDTDLEKLHDSFAHHEVEDIVARLQFEFEETLCDWFTFIPEEFKSRNLCLGGGCALNILANRRLNDLPLVDEVWAHPASNDSGLPIGAALSVWLTQKPKGAETDRESLRNPYLGIVYTDEEVKNAIVKFGVRDL